jgi:hypothetical protein
MRLPVPVPARVGLVLHTQRRHQLFRRRQMFQDAKCFKCALTPGGRYFVGCWTRRVRARPLNNAYFVSSSGARVWIPPKDLVFAIDHRRSWCHPHLRCKAMPRQHRLQKLRVPLNVWLIRLHVGNRYQLHELLHDRRLIGRNPLLHRVVLPCPDAIPSPASKARTSSLRTIAHPSK